MKHIPYKQLTLFFTFICAGIIFFAYQQQWIVILMPFSSETLDTNCSITVQHKKISLYFWKHEKWQKEHSSMIWSSNESNNIKILTNQWFNLMEDEEILDNDIQVMSVIISQNHEAFLSLNKYPFNQSHATYTKLMIIEGLLKSLKINNIKIQSIRFLVHHQPLKDDHLNFNFSWPLSGFLQKQ